MNMMGTAGIHLGPRKKTAQIFTGTYVGDGAPGQTLRLPFVPKHVEVTDTTGGPTIRYFFKNDQMGGATCIEISGSPAASIAIVSAITFSGRSFVVTGDANLPAPGGPAQYEFTAWG